MQYRTTIQLLIAGLFLFATVHSSSALENTTADEWQFGVEFYVFMPDIKAETTSGNDIDISFHDILENLNMTFMGVLAARKNKWLFAVDGIYLDIEDDEKGSFNVPFPIGPGVTVGNDIDVEMKAWVVTPIVGYNVYESSNSRIDLVAGARYLWIEVDSEVKLYGPLETSKAKVTDDGEVWDGIVGARGLLELTEKWYATCFFDVGTGDTEFTWQVWAGLGYKFDKFNTVFGYRHIDWDFDDDDIAFKDLQVSGPYVGANFMF